MQNEKQCKLLLFGNIRKLAIRTPSFQLLMDLCQQKPAKAAEEIQHYLINSIKEDSTRSKPKEETAGGTSFLGYRE
jgi:hypothetical protein